MDRNNPISVWVGNLNEYNSGNLSGKWLDLPMEDQRLYAELREISRSGKNEIMIFDIETRENSQFMYDRIGEFDDISELNVVAKLIGTDMHEKAELYMNDSGTLSMSEIANILYQEDELSYMDYEFDGSDDPNVMDRLSIEEKLGYTLIESDPVLLSGIEKLKINGIPLYSYVNIYEIGRDAILNGGIQVGAYGYMPNDQDLNPNHYTIQEINEAVNVDFVKEMEQLAEHTPEKPDPEMTMTKQLKQSSPKL